MATTDELRTVLETYVQAYRRGDAAACAAVYAPDARVISPFGPPAHGRDEIEALHREWCAEGGAQKSLEIVEQAQAGNLAWCLARFSEGNGTEQGLSLNVFERQPDGQWRIRLSSLNEGE